MTFFTSVSKFSVTVFDFLYLVVGFFILYQTTAIQQYLLKNGYDLEGPLNLSLYLAFVLSIVIICTGLFGCYGIFTEGSRMIQMYAILILISLVLQGTIATLVYRTLLKSVRDETIAQFTSQQFEVQEYIQMVQQENSCCGVRGAQDYGLPPQQIPSSCCGRYVESRLTNIGDCSVDELKNAKGCGLIRFLEIFKESLNIHFHKVPIVVGLVASVQVIFIGLSCMLSKRLGEQKRNVKALAERTLQK